MGRVHTNSACCCDAQLPHSQLLHDPPRRVSSSPRVRLRSFRMPSAAPRGGEAQDELRARAPV